MIRASSILFWFALTIAASVILYHTSYRVQELSHQLHELNASIETEQRNIHVMKAEWVYLSNPARVAQTAMKYLPLKPVSLQQYAKLENLPELVPTRGEAMADITVNGTPIANVKTSLAAPPVTEVVRVKKVAAAQDTGHLNTRMQIQRADRAVTPDEAHVVLANYGLHQ